MKKFFLCCFLLIFFPSIGFCNEIYGIAKYDFEIKSKPSFDGISTGKIYTDEKIILLEKSGNWVKGTNKKNTGWISIAWINQFGDLSKLPSSKTPVFKETSPEKIFIPFIPHRYGNSKFRVYAQQTPSRGSPNSVWLKEGERVKLLGIQEESLKIKTEDNEIAWISSGLIEISENSSDAESIQNILEQNRLTAKINGLKRDFNMLSPRKLKSRLKIAKELFKLDPENDEFKIMVEYYQKKITTEKIQTLDAIKLLLDDQVTSYGTRIEVLENQANAKIEYKSHSTLLRELNEKSRVQMWTPNKLQLKTSYLPKGGMVIVNIWGITIGSANTKYWEYIVQDRKGNIIKRKQGNDGIDGIPNHTTSSRGTKWWNIAIVSIDKKLSGPFKVFVIDSLSNKRSGFLVIP